MTIKPANKKNNTAPTLSIIISMMFSGLMNIQATYADDATQNNKTPAQSFNNAQAKLATQAKLKNKPPTQDDKIILSTITVQAEPTEAANQDYTISNSSTATKTDTPTMDTPLSIEVVPKAVMQDQQAIQLSDVTKNVSSVYKGTSLGGFVDQFMIRGFNTSYTNYYDGYRFPQGSGLSLANAERVEVIKGAAANLY